MRKAIVIASAVVSILYSIFLIVYWISDSIRMFPFTWQEMLITAGGVIFLLFLLAVSLVVLFNIKLPKALRILLVIVSFILALIPLAILGMVLFTLITGHGHIETSSFIVACLVCIATSITTATYIIRSFSQNAKTDKTDSPKTNKWPLYITLCIIAFMIIGIIGFTWFEASDYQIWVNLRSNNFKVRDSTVCAIPYRKNAKIFIPEIRKLLNDDNFYVRHASICTLTKLGDKESIPAITKLLKDKNNAIRSSAEDALRKLGVPEEEIRKVKEGQ